MNVNDIYPSKYVKAADLGDKNVTVTIKTAVMESLGYGKESESKLVIYFEKASKGLILNRTNAMIIASMYTPETDNWIGKAIILYAARVKAFGAWHNAVRVREQIPPRNVGAERMTEAMTEQPPIDDEDDLLDVDEGQEPPARGDRIDPSTGEILDDAHDALREPENYDTPAPAASKDKVLSAAQLKRINVLGTKLHPGKGEWDAERPRYIEWVTTGAVSSAKQLQPSEADTLIAGLERKLAKLAAQVQATAQHATNGAAKVAA